MKQGGLILAAGRVRSKKKKTIKMKKTRKNRPAQNTPRNPQQHGDRVQLETACEQTRPTRSLILSRFYRSRVCANRPSKALAISKDDKYCTYTDRQTDRQTD